MPKGARNPDPMYGISLLATKWLVILTRDGVCLQKTFSHKTYEGVEGALAAAQAWRDEMIRRHPPVLKRERAQKLIATNTSGIAGVRCRLGPDGKPQLWMVATCIDSKRVLKSFSVGRYGEQARELAIAERQKHLALVIGRVSHHPADQVEPDTPPIAPERWQTQPYAKSQVVRTNNKSGVSGVYCRSVKGEPRHWVARTRVDDQIVYKAFAVETHGEQKAKELAIAERQKQLQWRVLLRASSSPGASAEPNIDPIIERP